MEGSGGKGRVTLGGKEEGREVGMEEGREKRNEGEVSVVKAEKWLEQDP